MGGGIVRDLILGITPPNAFRDPFPDMVAIFVSAVFFLRRFQMCIRDRGPGPFLELPEGGGRGTKAPILLPSPTGGPHHPPGRQAASAARPRPRMVDETFLNHP